MNPTAGLVANEVERTIQRSLKGLEYFASPAPAVGHTPKDVLYEQGTLHLYHYHPQVGEIYRVPILIVMATSNRGYILDLAPGQSFVEYLLRQGYDVYLIDWSAPVAADSTLTFADYVTRFIPECVQLVRDDSGVNDVTVIGYCMGGVLSVMYAALHPGDYANLVCFTTPVDFSKMELFAKWSDRRYFDVDRLVDATGNVPSELIFTSFEMLRPATRVAGQFQLWENIGDERFVRSYRAFERWSTDTLPLAGEYFRETIKELIWENRLYRNEMVIDGRHADLGAITVPVLHAMAEHDHIVPHDAAKPLIELVGSSDKEEIVLKGGHVSLVAGANAVKRLWPRLDAWLGARST
ncbi:MAG TPA: alpha/beta fold hydrolase [Candidatus Elarobacter sp.]|jgi:polyhydroxyalkanoate synthase|nr:alpha/beta fold hydrolase [Candidatus Elarobacter sp.]